jgi:hypothetical protein
VTGCATSSRAGAGAPRGRRFAGVNLKSEKNLSSIFPPPAQDYRRPNAYSQRQPGNEAGRSWEK